MLMMDANERENKDEVMTSFQMEKSLNSLDNLFVVKDSISSGWVALPRAWVFRAIWRIYRHPAIEVR